MFQGLRVGADVGRQKAGHGRLRGMVVGMTGPRSGSGGFGLFVWVVGCKSEVRVVVFSSSRVLACLLLPAHPQMQSLDFRLA